MTRDAELAARDYLAAGAVRHRQRDRHRRRPVAAAPGAVGHRPVRRPGVARAGPGARSPTAARTHAARRRARQRPAARLGPCLRRRRRAPTSSSTLLRGAARRHARRSRAWPSTPTCAGRCCTGSWRGRGRRRRDRRRAATATPRPPASGTPRPPGRRARPPRPRPRRGRLVVERRDLPNAVQEAVIGGFVPDRPARAAGARTCARTSPRSSEVWETRTAEIAQNIVDRAVPVAAGRRRRPCERDRRLAGLGGARCPGAAAAGLEGRDGVARALRAQERDRTATVA